MRLLRIKQQFSFLGHGHNFFINIRAFGTVSANLSINNKIQEKNST
jgi:hypothetical protein